MRLTHSVLADLVAARRPTVSTSLAELAKRRLVWAEGDEWLLAGEPPTELLELQDVAVGASTSPTDRPVANAAVPAPARG
jgi:hypothetical protein